MEIQTFVLSDPLYFQAEEPSGLGVIPFQANQSAHAQEELMLASAVHRPRDLLRCGGDERGACTGTAACWCVQWRQHEATPAGAEEEDNIGRDKDIAVNPSKVLGCSSASSSTNSSASSVHGCRRPPPHVGQHSAVPDLVRACSCHQCHVAKQG
ncbi:hypothetical protein BRADI_1g57205v3 [Brachypodium distachyon]|uniref:Uncharacterized protein n=1 Tax=Brachypodium distachyon TaxID=15368 RepID=A0A2K2DS07_BRADI|nr:hypothetical protein BRADI_1g57205v3 [Brachypodium distachyon]